MPEKEGRILTLKRATLKNSFFKISIKKYVIMLRCHVLMFLDHSLHAPGHKIAEGAQVPQEDALALGQVVAAQCRYSGSNPCSTP
jgi:hypothetical protein